VRLKYAKIYNQWKGVQQWLKKENELSYTSSVDDLDRARLAFRELNRKLRKASFNTTVEFEDE
jgi:hypothetical protein